MPYAHDHAQCIRWWSFQWRKVMPDAHDYAWCPWSWWRALDIRLWGLKPFHTPSALRKHEYEHRDNKISCTKCNKVFPFQSQLDSHMVSYRDLATFKCMVKDCSKWFKNKGDLTKHLKSTLVTFTLVSIVIIPQIVLRTSKVISWSIVISNGMYVCCVVRAFVGHRNVKGIWLSARKTRIRNWVAIPGHNTSFTWFTCSDTRLFVDSHNN